MSIRCDLSSMSDTSSLPSASRSDSSRLDSVQTEKSKALFKRNAATTNRVAKSLAFCEDATSDYIKASLILDCVQECSVDGTLSDETSNKLEGSLRMHKTDKCMHSLVAAANDKHTLEEDVVVLGIQNLPKYEFAYEEKLNIRCRVETLLREKIHNFILRYKEFRGPSKETVRSNKVDIRTELLDLDWSHSLQWKEMMEELCSQYRDNVVECIKLMNKWKALKYDNVPKIYHKRAEYLLLQAQVAEVRAKIVKLSCILSMFKETPVTLEAFKILNETLEDKVSKLRCEIEQKRNLRRNYEESKCTEFDDVLKEYVQVCRAIERKGRILELL